MQSLNTFQKMKIGLFNAYSGKLGKMLIHTGVIGWAMSSLAQVFAIAFNEKIPKEQKMFMIPQELADAVVNIASFYFVTRSITGISNKFVKIGKFLPENVSDALNVLGKRIPDKIKNLGNYNFNVEKYLKQVPQKSIRNDYYDFKDGVDVISTLVGSVISCNVITPILRNIYASHKQKKNITKMNTPADPAKPQSRYAKYNPLAGKNIYSFTNRGDLKV